MTHEEAIKILELNSICSPKATEFKNAVEIAKNAIEKQILKRPKIKSFPKTNGFELRCPNGDCGAVLQSDSPYCRYCGQALDWSDTE